MCNKILGDRMLFSRVFQGFAIGMTAFSLLWENYFILKQKENKSSIEDSWNNVGKILNKAVQDYEKNVAEKG